MIAFLADKQGQSEVFQTFHQEWFKIKSNFLSDKFHNVWITSASYSRFLKVT